MKDRLEPLAIVPAPLEHAPIQHRSPSSLWQSTGGQTAEEERDQKPTLTLPSRLFWCDPPWYRYDHALADMIAIAVANFGVTVSATLWDLSSESLPTKFHDTQSEHDQESPNHHIDRLRMLPYRPERFGVTREDFHEVSAIDVRLLPERDPSGAPFFEVAKVAHFGAMDSDETQPEPQSLPSLTIPPDITGIDGLEGKLSQLRSLSSGAAIFVSILPHRLNAVLPVIATQNPDGVMLRCDDSTISGLDLVSSLRSTLGLLRKSGQPPIPVLIAPGQISTSDAIKLHRLGAAAIAIDSWCNDVLEGIDDFLSQPSTGRSVNQTSINRIAKHHLADRIERFNASQKSQQVTTLTTKDEAWSRLFA